MVFIGAGDGIRTHDPNLGKVGYLAHNHMKNNNKSAKNIWLPIRCPIALFLAETSLNGGRGTGDNYGLSNRRVFDLRAAVDVLLRDGWYGSGYEWIEPGAGASDRWLVRRRDNRHGRYAIYDRHGSRSRAPLLLSRHRSLYIEEGTPLTF